MWSEYGKHARLTTYRNSDNNVSGPTWYGGLCNFQLTACLQPVVLDCLTASNEFHSPRAGDAADT